jgi:hypothetical protein
MIDPAYEKKAVCVSGRNAIHFGRLSRVDRPSRPLREMQRRPQTSIGAAPQRTIGAIDAVALVTARHQTGATRTLPPPAF